MSRDLENLDKLSSAQRCFLLILRLSIGWHFLYEGYVKIVSSDWSAVGYLNAAPGPFDSFFGKIASTPWMLATADFSMKYGLMVIGVALILGLFSRLALVGAALMLVLFYLSNPPWLGVQFMAGEGSYLFVNKNLVELAAVLVLLVFPIGLIWGFDRLFAKE